MRTTGIGGLIVVIWLIIGAIAAGQRGYFSNEDTNCAEAGNTIVTIVAGPLNYFGINPKLDCALPQPSK
ncbi:hypothetical protein SAMN05421812_111167 [Asanoa hainanensis]|uniref:Uncharacterized protein n=1 Tax=Asanoa hainanensis TaxID=560556 RepID=A0A239NX17_9ACTN|nr:hypothetical protein [Asanoa hainanensis]SNT59365.1 hypothetical protein SAMN05421812_111167 [Asanoa hainanensis]